MHLNCEYRSIIVQGARPDRFLLLLPVAIIIFHALFCQCSISGGRSNKKDACTMCLPDSRAAYRLLSRSLSPRERLAFVDQWIFISFYLERPKLCLLWKSWRLGPPPVPKPLAAILIPLSLRTGTYYVAVFCFHFRFLGAQHRVSARILVRSMDNGKVRT